MISRSFVMAVTQEGGIVTGCGLGMVAGHGDRIEDAEAGFAIEDCIRLFPCIALFCVGDSRPYLADDLVSQTDAGSGFFRRTKVSAIFDGRPPGPGKVSPVGTDFDFRMVSLASLRITL